MTEMPNEDKSKTVNGTSRCDRTHATRELSMTLADIFVG
ncbi:hypothetical protein BH23CHL5_BH23CHL5_13000 [soil metagenome]